MKKSLQNIILFSLVILFFLIISKIQLLIIYFFISIVISITINPISNLLCKINIFSFKINETLAAVICLLMITIIGGLVGYIFSPLILDEIQIIKSIQLNEVQSFLNIA